MPTQGVIRERPIPFSSPMVRSILAGRKAQTRRVMKPQPCLATDTDGQDYFLVDFGNQDRGYGWKRSDPPYWTYCPYGIPGDRLWVRETAIITPKRWDDMRTFTCLDPDGDKRWVQYLATSPNRDAANDYGLKAYPSIFMPRWASRITLEITDVRVQRVREISEEDADAEGVEWAGNGVNKGYVYARWDFMALWDSINAKRGFGWDANPWVWALTFKRIEQVAA